MVIKLIILGALILGALFFAPQVFKYADAGSNPAPTETLVPPNVTDGNLTLPFDLPEMSPGGFLDWLQDSLGWVSNQAINFINDFIITNAKKIIPNASDAMIWVIIAVIGLLIIWLKAESVAGLIRVITLILVAILVGVLVLMLLGFI